MGLVKIVATYLIRQAVALAYNRSVFESSGKRKRWTCWFRASRKLDEIYAMEEAYAKTNG